MGWLAGIRFKIPFAAFQRLFGGGGCYAFCKVIPCCLAHIYSCNAMSSVFEVIVVKRRRSVIESVLN